MSVTLGTRRCLGRVLAGARQSACRRSRFASSRPTELPADGKLNFSTNASIARAKASISVRSATSAFSSSACLARIVGAPDAEFVLRTLDMGRRQSIPRFGSSFDALRISRRNTVRGDGVGKFGARPIRLGKFVLGFRRARYRQIRRRADPARRFLPILPGCVPVAVSGGGEGSKDSATLVQM